MGSIIEENDEILLPGPYYPPYSSYAKFYGANIREFKILTDGTPDLDDIRKKITNKPEQFV